MATGTVKMFRKTYGFIRPDEGGEDLFVHHTAIQMEGYRELVSGDRVQYEVGQGKKGPEAKNVVRLDG